MVGATRPDRALRVVPANEAPWQSVERVLGKARHNAALCCCQRFKIGWSAWRATVEERAGRLREQAGCGPRVRPRRAGCWPTPAVRPLAGATRNRVPPFPCIPGTRIAGKQRGQDEDDESVRAVACFVTRARFGHGGVTCTLAAAAAGFARARRPRWRATR
jgi:hypothetical protein